MSKPRHRAPAARIAELLQIVKQPVPRAYGYTPVNRAQRRARVKAARKRGDMRASGGAE